ncbi:MAG: rRNA maturation RNase YbeY [Ignavibacteriaceae bacterium]
MLKNLEVNSSKSNRINKGSIHAIISGLRKDLEFELTSLVINFVLSSEIMEINKKFLNHRYSTDIITFNYNGNHDILDGEIFISFEDAELNAKKFGVNPNEEIIRLVIHGILHLLGYDDQIKKDKIIMKKLENKLCSNYWSIFRTAKIYKS